MAIRKIARLGEPILRHRASTIPLETLVSAPFQQLVDDMIETMRDADGAGLAAPQVYEGLRVCVVEVKENPRYPGLPPIPLTVFVNPELSTEPGREAPLPEGHAVALYEGCLSVPGLRGLVRRPRKAKVRALDRHGKPFERQWEGVGAAVIQHELDHLDGILFIDRCDSTTLTFLKEYERYVPVDQRVRDCF